MQRAKFMLGFAPQCLALFCAASHASAQWIPGELSASAALTSTYAFRGIDQSDGPAIQGRFEYLHPIGAYAGIWASNVDLGGSVKVEFYGGYTREIGVFSYDVYVLYNLYPNDETEPDELDYYEFGVEFGYKTGPFLAEAGLAYSMDYFNETGDTIYADAQIGVAVTDALSADATIGYSWIEDNARWGSPDYLDFSIGAKYNYQKYSLEFRWVGTNLDEIDCFGGQDICKGRFIATLAAQF